MEIVKDNMKMTIEGVLRGKTKFARTLVIDDLTNINDMRDVFKNVSYFFMDMTFTPNTVRDALLDVAEEIGKQASSREGEYDV